MEKDNQFRANSRRRDARFRQLRACAILLALIVAFTAVYSVRVSALNKENLAKIETLEKTNEDIKEAYTKDKSDLTAKNKTLESTYAEITAEKEQLFAQVEELELKVAETELKVKETESKLTELKKKTTKTVTPSRGYVSRISADEVSGLAAEEVLFEVTMYNNTGGAYAKDSPHYGTMANGEKTHYGAAAGPKSLPFGTKIVLSETKSGFENIVNDVFVVKDRGGAIKEKTVNGQKVYCIDIYQPDLQTAKNWGRQIVKGKIIK